MAPPPKTPATPRDAAPTAAVTRSARPGQRPLFAAPAVAPRPPLPRSGHPGTLWLGLYLPSLPLDVQAADRPVPAYAVFEEEQGLRRILMASKAAAAAGIHAGLAVNAALALLPDLALEPRDPAREARTLRQLAAWAERYTSFVVLEPPATLLLEIGASRRLFGGLRALRHRILAALEVQGYRALPAIAPTPLAATWLARAGTRRCLTRGDRLAGALSRLPLHCLGWPAATVDALEGMGVTRIGDCLRLPRAGFARRFGVLRRDELDRALGRAPDPRDHYRAPPRFVAVQDLDEEQDDRERLLAVCSRLLEQLGRFLLARQLAVARLHFDFFHWRRAATSLTLGRRRAEHDGARWMELLRLRFERFELPAPVIAVRLRAGRSRPLGARSAALRFTADGPSPDERPIGELVERLAARMGEGAIHGVTTVAEHRPDYAWRPWPALEETPHCRATPCLRPLWMLDAPLALDCRDGQPCYRGLLALVNGPERIESGWWDAAGVARDYYVARNPSGLHLWVFRDRGMSRTPGGWYLHGIFG